MKRDFWSEITYFYNGQIGNLFLSLSNLYRVNHAETCALVFALTPLSNVINRRDILMTCSAEQDLAVVQDFSTAGLATYKFHSISTVDSFLEMEDRQHRRTQQTPCRSMVPTILDLTGMKPPAHAGEVESRCFA
jgi:hypothetical protein